MNGGKRGQKTWVRWLMLAAALCNLLGSWLSIAQWRRITAISAQLISEGLFTPDSLALWQAEQQFQWMISGTLVLVFLVQFAVWGRARDTRTDCAAWLLVYLLVGAAWAASPWLLSFDRWDGPRKFVWGLMILLPAIFAGYSLLKWRRAGKRQDALEEPG